VPQFAVYRWKEHEIVRNIVEFGKNWKDILFVNAY
jgi:hypothetical protein